MHNPGAILPPSLLPPSLPPSLLPPSLTSPLPPPPLSLLPSLPHLPPPSFPHLPGKTTLISVLTGLYEPTSGKARIAGYDLATDIGAIHHHLGGCPQFDIHHAKLTAEEHLLFYARLKGVKRSKEKAVETRALRQVQQLKNQYNILLHSIKVWQCCFLPVTIITYITGRKHKNCPVTSMTHNS